jgi:8-oxo-dGTP diphosphatase
MRQESQPTAPSGRRGVVAITRRSSDGRFLVIRRGRTVMAGGQVCFPGGHIEPGEGEDEAIVRECREELAARVEATACVWRSVTTWGTALAWWCVVLDEGEPLVPHPVEVDEILWLSPQEMLDHPELLQGNRPFLEAVIEGRLEV